MREPDSYSPRGRRVSGTGEREGGGEIRRILIVSPLLNRGPERTPLSHLGSRHAARLGFARGMCTSRAWLRLRLVSSRLSAFLARLFLFPSPVLLFSNRAAAPEELSTPRLFTAFFRKRRGARGSYSDSTVSRGKNSRGSRVRVAVQFREERDN